MNEIIFSNATTLSFLTQVIHLQSITFLLLFRAIRSKRMIVPPLYFQLFQFTFIAQFQYSKSPETYSSTLFFQQNCLHTPLKSCCSICLLSVSPSRTDASRIPAQSVRPSNWSLLRSGSWPHRQYRRSLRRDSATPQLSQRHLRW